MSVLRRLAARAAQWLVGDSPTAPTWRVPASGWPGGVRDSDLPVERVYEVLDDAFDTYWDTAVASLAGQEATR